MDANTQSLWSSAKTPQPTARLAGNVTYDVCVVGAGIAGLTTAYLLAKEGKKVLVVDAKPEISAGETEYTTAHLAWYLDDQFTHLASVRGDDVAKAAAASHRAAIDLIGEIARAEKIDCDYKRVEGHLFAGDSGADVLDEEEKTMTRLGLPFTRSKLDWAPGKSSVCLRFPDHAQVHPIKYTAGLIGAIRANGGAILTDTVVEKIRGGDASAVTTTHGHTISSQTVVVATNNPFEAGTILHSKVAAYITYAFAAEVPKGSAPHGLYWDTEDPYHYVRYQTGEKTDYLIVGGEDHKTGQATDQPERWDRLKAWAKGYFPAMGAIRHHWSGQVFETPDGLGLIGLAPWNGQNVFVITGDSGMGMTHGTLGARLVADLVLGRTNDWAPVYSPSRIMPGALRTLLGENFNMVAQFGDWLTGGDVASADEVPAGHGAVIRSGLTKHAVFNSREGQRTTLSAVCPHMGAIVRWNPAESTWDCPCHGSRFSATGTCLHGPSTTDLKKVGESA